MRLIAVTAGIGVCLWIIWTVTSFGLSRLLVKYALMVGDIAAANEAIKLTPSDAAGHVARAGVLSVGASVEEAEAELERAIALRPLDYYLWLQLGLLRDRGGDSAGALAAFNESVRLASYYADPRWQRGNLLVRMGRYEEAFADLNQAARSDPELVPNLLDLAWGLSKGDLNLTEQLVQIDNNKMRIEFAKFLARRGKATEAIAQFRAVGNVPEGIGRELLGRLLATNAFKEAFEVWKVTQPGESGNRQMPTILDGGFEGALTFDEADFGWRVPRRLPATTTSLETGSAHSGSKNLKLEFTGDSAAGTPLVSQLIVVEPSKRYRVSFAARSQDVVTGGLPLAIVNDASGDGKVLGQSEWLLKGTAPWKVFSFEFAATPTTAGVILSIRREGCTTSPCPAFGSISLDSFSIEQVK